MEVHPFGLGSWSCAPGVELETLSKRTIEMKTILKKLLKVKSVTKKLEIIAAEKDAVATEGELEIFQNVMDAARNEQETCWALGVIAKFDFAGKKDFLLAHARSLVFDQTRMGTAFVLLHLCGYETEAEAYLKEVMGREKMQLINFRLQLLAYGTVFPSTEKWCRPELTVLAKEAPNLAMLCETPSLSNMGLFMLDWEHEMEESKKGRFN
jgi:hypothetical protein